MNLSYLVSNIRFKHEDYGVLTWERIRKFIAKIWYLRYQPKRYNTYGANTVQTDTITFVRLANLVKRVIQGSELIKIPLSGIHNDFQDSYDHFAKLGEYETWDSKFVKYNNSLSLSNFSY